MGIRPLKLSWDCSRNSPRSSAARKIVTMADQQTQPQGGGLPMSPAQKMAVEQFANQQKPFGWLQEIIQRVMGQGQPTAPAKGTTDTSTAKGKKSEATPAPAQTPGQ